MKPIIFIYVLAISIFILGCSSEKSYEEIQKNRIDSLKTYVESGHDAIMPDINNIMQKRTQVAAIRNSILDTLPQGSEVTERMRINISDLNKAEAMMFDWMQDYSNTYNDSLPDPEKIKILEMNSREIKKMTELFENSQKEAELIIEKHGTVDVK